jgi:hypothetical protein
MESFREVISNPVHKTKELSLYGNILPVHKAVSNATGVQLATSVCPGITSSYIDDTTTKNNKSISLPASNENTG